MVLWVILVAVEESVLVSVVILVVLRAAAVHFVVVVLAFGLRHAADVFEEDVEETVAETTRAPTMVSWSVDGNSL